MVAALNRRRVVGSASEAGSAAIEQGSGPWARDDSRCAGIEARSVLEE